MVSVVEITGNPRAVMNYAHYEEEIVQRYGIEIQGWTYEKILNPSLLSSSLPPLMVLRDALVAGTCKFVKLTAEERKKCQAAYLEKVKSGEIEVRKRKRRSDAGTRKKLKRAHPEVDTANDGADDAHKSQELIDDTDSAGDCSE
jgi:hypothetical protein